METGCATLPAIVTAVETCDAASPLVALNAANTVARRIHRTTLSKLVDRNRNTAGLDEDVGRLADCQPQTLRRPGTDHSDNVDPRRDRHRNFGAHWALD